MKVEWDAATKRLVDVTTGHNLVFRPKQHFQDDDKFWIKDSDGTTVFAAIVQMKSEHAGDLMTPVVSVRYVLEKGWFPTGKPELPEYFYGSSDWIERLGNFLRHWHSRQYRDREVPEFEFEDGRIEP